MEYEKTASELSFEVRAEKGSEPNGVLFVFLDRRFLTGSGSPKPHALPLSDLYGKWTKVQFVGLRVVLEEPSVMFEVYAQREGERSYIVLGCERVSFRKLQGLTECSCSPLLRFDGVGLSVRSTKLSSELVDRSTFRSNLELSMVDILKRHMNAVDRGMKRFKFDKLGPYVVFARRDIRSQFPLVTQFLMGKEWSRWITNEKFWRKLLDAYKETNKILMDLETSSDHWRTHRKPRAFNEETDWVGLICFLPNRCMNYRTDFPEDVYHEPYYTNCGDCEDLVKVAIHLYQSFVDQTFADQELQRLQGWAKKYVSCFTFCLTKTPQFSVGSIESSPTGHICWLLISKGTFRECLSSDTLKKLMGSGGSEEPEHRVLIGELTAIVEPFLSKPKSAYDALTGNELKLREDLQRRLVTYSNYKSVKDPVSIRVISEPSLGFYQGFAMVFTPHFLRMDPSCGQYAFILATGSRSYASGGLSYGMTIKDLLDMDRGTELERFHIVPQPAIIGKSLKDCRLFSNFLGCVPPMRFDEGRNGFEEVCSGTNAFVAGIPDPKALSELKERFGRSEKVEYEMVCYTFLSDIDLSKRETLSNLDRFLSTNNLRLDLRTYPVARSASAHLLTFHATKNTTKPHPNNAFLFSLYATNAKPPE